MSVYSAQSSIGFYSLHITRNPWPHVQINNTGYLRRGSWSSYIPLWLLLPAVKHLVIFSSYGGLAPHSAEFLLSFTSPEKDITSKNLILLTFSKVCHPSAPQTHIYCLCKHICIMSKFKCDSESLNVKIKISLIYVMHFIDKTCNFRQLHAFFYIIDKTYLSHELQF